MKIEFISDVVCPWCAIGLNSLERALERIGDALEVDLLIRPFELNPKMPPEGESADIYLARKYGLNAEQMARNHALLCTRGAAVGFQFGERKQVWNSFDAHRLLHWAGMEGHQRDLKHALLRAYHGRGENISAHEVLVALAREAGLDGDSARDLLQSDAYGGAVRTSEHRWERLGIQSVPTALIDGRHLIQGGHQPEVFETALRQIAAGEV
ncbi:MAG: DsbA family oxidoreductase [Rhodocyclaceae bacterium]|nr:DsbA family oxidoreductase [Rhodocyclaceae bacterium]MBX3669885.1 DsbA family oxidoreductase [Rhodocyclaceae bacterium]